MAIDQERIRAILQGRHHYYGGRELPIRKDYRWVPTWQHLIAPQLSPEMDVLDVGCGDGGFLLELSPWFKTGLGIDIDPEFLRMAEGAKRAQAVNNVDFRLLDFPGEQAALAPESFDLLVSLRGPLPDTAEGIQAAHHLLRAGGLLYCEEIAELHQKEIAEIFTDRFPRNAGGRKVEALSALVARHGFEVRLAADIFSKWIYPDVYAWVQYVCNLWTWSGIPLLEADDARIEAFARRNTNAAGEIETTHHVAWVAAIKK